MNDIQVRSHFLFAQGSRPEERIISGDYKKMEDLVGACRLLGMRIVLTSGTFDLFHEGHARYLERAKQQGDILIVGVDADEKVRERKGPRRPIVSQDSRMEILCHLRHVDLVFLKQKDDPRRELIRVVHPDVLVATQTTYKPEEVAELEAKHCGRVMVLEPQAATSTTARIRKLLMAPVDQMRGKLEEVMAFLNEIAKH